MVNADGTGQAQITQTGDHAVSPAWSPDGTQIAYAVGVGPIIVGGSPGENGPPAGIYVVNADGSGSRQLTTTEGDDFPGVVTRWATHRLLERQQDRGGEHRRDRPAT